MHFIKERKCCTAQNKIRINLLRAQIDALKDKEIDSLSIGVYAEKIDLDYLLEEGDRVEIYRPLTADPKEVRRQLALMGKTMGKK